MYTQNAAGIKNRNPTLHKIEGNPDQFPNPWHTPPIYPFPLCSLFVIGLFLKVTVSYLETADSIISPHLNYLISIVKYT